ncbi:hypothetical protein BDN72DRAFT_868273 [Pluteus cervinus]|uniref:Uncharacterized protein n=1 Tax=Pluteus cervinus TaxID=181527 RepID=A0ACD3BAM4_9AGAR|nr:hypothetical protein BDN72DRAFT_868273 [Pluteus cervinus]
MPSPSTTQHALPPDDRESQKHYSIDLSLELEHQLDMESQPSTPFKPDMDTSSSEDSLDPQVLTHIVVQLRNSLAAVTKERDQLRHLLLVSQSREASLKEAAALVAEKVETLELELSEVKAKNLDKEESITMLRSKVEESRRGLMRLQTENRRQSLGPAALDLSRASLANLANFSGPPSSKRASFTPLTGTFTARPSGHRRVSSVSDSGDTSPQPQAINLPDSKPPSSTRRFSGLFGRASPPQIELQDPVTAEMESLKREVARLREDLESTRHDLTESVEAREASETCVKALREFIAENNVGVGGSVATLPRASTQGDSSSAGGWGFKLWKGDVAKSSPGPTPGHDRSPSLSSAAPLSRKIGDFFSSRAANSTSVGSPPQSQTVVTRSSQRDSMYSFSDASSVAEPVSPAGEVNGHHVLVRDVAGNSDTGSASISPDPPKGMGVRIVSN